MSETEPDFRPNPAAVLARRLNSLRLHEDTTDVMNVWKREFDTKDNAEVFIGLAKLNRSLQLVKTYVAKQAIYKIERFQSLDRLTTVISPTSLTSNWANSKQHITNEAISILGIISDMWDNSTLAVPLGSMLTKMIEDIFKIIEDINASELDERIKEGLTFELEEILEKIKEYRDFGINNLRSALYGGIGALTCSYPHFPESEAALFSKIWTFLGTAVVNYAAEKAFDRVYVTGQEVMKRLPFGG